MAEKKKNQAKNMIADPFETHSINEIASILKISETKLKSWITDDEFMGDTLEIHNQYSKNQLIEVMKVLNKLCAKGDIRAIKLFFDLREKIIDTKKNMVEIIDDIPNK